MTKLEARVLQAILNSEYGDGDVGKSTWTFSLSYNGAPDGKSLSGAISSTNKKGFTKTADYEGRGRANDQTITLTQKGFDALNAYKAENGDPCPKAR
ncbi:MAG TPA: hypothetical protein VI911_09785 [Patescibacteria group bacterium]|nr:hypothetical protein [Patescibacteria group bacterium]